MVSSLYFSVQLRFPQEFRYALHEGRLGTLITVFAQAIAIWVSNQQSPSASITQYIVALNGPSLTTPRRHRWSCLYVLDPSADLPFLRDLNCFLEFKNHNDKNSMEAVSCLPVSWENLNVSSVLVVSCVCLIHWRLLNYAHLPRNSNLQGSFLETHLSSQWPLCYEEKMCNNSVYKGELSPEL